jgi:LysM repeat protein
MDETIVRELVRETRRLKRRLWLERSLFILLIAPVGTLWLYPRVAGGPTAIQVDGRTVAVVADRDAAERALAAVKQSRAGADAAHATFARPVELRRVGRAAGSAVPEAVAVERLAAAVSIQAPRAVILVDGKPVVALPTEREAGAALAMVKAHFAEQAGRLVEEPRFKQQVTIRRQLASDAIWRPRAEVAARFLREGPATTAARHTIVAGDTPSGIAGKYDLTLEELTRLNPGMRPGALRVGDTLNIRSPAQAPLTVVVRARVRRLPRSLRTPDLRRGPAEVTYENGLPVAATAVTRTPALNLPRGGVVRF